MKLGEHVKTLLDNEKAMLEKRIKTSITNVSTMKHQLDEESEYLTYMQEKLKQINDVLAVDKSDK